MRAEDWGLAMRILQQCGGFWFDPKCCGRTAEGFDQKGLTLLSLLLNAFYFFKLHLRSCFFYLWCRLVVSNFLGFCLSENVFISASFLKDIFPGSQFLGWQLSTSFNTWKLSFHCLLMSIVSVGKAVDSFIIAALQVNFFSLTTFKIFLCFWFSTVLPWCG